MELNTSLKKKSPFKQRSTPRIQRQRVQAALAKSWEILGIWTAATAFNPSIFGGVKSCLTTGESAKIQSQRYLARTKVQEGFQHGKSKSTVDIIGILNTVVSHCLLNTSLNISYITILHDHLYKSNNNLPESCQQNWRSSQGLDNLLAWGL